MIVFSFLQEAEVMHKKAIEIKEQILGSEVRTTLAKSRRSQLSSGSN